MRDLLNRPRILAAAALLATLAACGKNTATTLLAPSGSRPVPANSSVSGRVNFGTGSYAKSLVLLAPVRSGIVSSTYASISVTGNLVAAGYVPAAAPTLTQLAPRSWVDTLTILPGVGLHWKFVTDKNYDSPPDYGHPSDRTGNDGLVNYAVNPANGPQGDLIADVGALAGLVVCSLEEDAVGVRADYAFRAVGAGSPAAFTSTSDGSFAIDGLKPGRYNVLIRTPGTLRDTLITNLDVSGPTDLGVIDLSGAAPVGSVTGTIDYAGPNGFADLASAPYPPTTVRLVQGGVTVTTLNTGRASAGFTFTNVTPGTYDVIADAPVFFPLTKSAVTVAAGPATDVGVFELIKNNAEVSNAINVAGDFNGFAPSDLLWEMSQNTLGVWSLVSPDSIAAGTQYMKFVTDYNFDTPPDYGGDETAIDVPVSDAVTYKVSGGGTAIKLNVTAKNVYQFTIDERRQTFSIQPYPAPVARPGRR
jgi:hypothetical protein